MQFAARKIIVLATIFVVSLTMSFASFSVPSYHFSGIAAGDHFKTAGAWMRPFYEGGKQNNHGDLLGYRANTLGIVFGFDEEILDRLKLGLALSYAGTKVNYLNHHDSHTHIYTRLATFYGTYQFCNAVYLDWLFSGGETFDKGQRVTDLVVNHFRYDGKQFSIAAIVSKDYLRNKIFFTPRITANYVYLNHDEHSETVDGNQVLSVPFYDSNVFTLGAGISGAQIVRCRKYALKPELQAMLYYDIVSGKQNSSSAFIIGGPALATTATPGRLTAQIGASMTFNIKEFSLKLEYDLQAKTNYFNNIAYINLRYIF